MILDTLENAHFYYGISTKFAIALKFLKNTDFSNFNEGKYEVDKDNIYALVQTYNTKLNENELFEAHRKFIDIQYVIQGEELLGYTNIRELRPKSVYNEENDIFFLEGTGDFFKLFPNNFAILMPQDAHKPAIAINQPSLVKKVVIKIKF